MVICEECQAWFLDPMPTAEEMSRYYEENADLGIANELRDWREGTSQWKWYSFLARRVVSQLTSNTNSRSSLKIADIGAGGLELSSAMIDQLEGSSMTAYDLHDLSDNLATEKFANSIQCKLLDLNDLEHQSLDKQDQSYDVVICISVIEHVIDPLMLMNFLHQISSPGALIYIVGPNSESMARKILGERWPYYTPDQHLTIPSSKSIERALSRIAPHDMLQFNAMPVRYSINYLMRFLGGSGFFPRVLDIALPLPTGAFELIWWKGLESK